MVKIKTTKDGDNYVNLCFKSMHITDDGVVTFWGDFRQITDIIIKLCFNSIFLKINNMELTRHLDTWTLDITPIDKFEITKEGELR